MDIAYWFFWQVHGIMNRDMLIWGYTFSFWDVFIFSFFGGLFMAFIYSIISGRFHWGL